MATPPLNQIEPRDAVQRVREYFGCTGDDAVRFLRDRWRTGEITPDFTRGEPPGGADPDLADWFTGAVVLPDKWLPRRAVSESGDDPEWQRVSGRSFPFNFDRRQLQAVLRAAGSEADSPEAPPRLRPCDPVPVHAEEGSPDRLRWDGVLLLVEAVGRLWPDLAEQIREYIHNIGRLHLRKPNPGAPGGDRVLIEIDDVYSEVSQPDDGERWVSIADLGGNEGVDKLEYPPSYEVPKPHPGEELKHRLRGLITDGRHEFVVRQTNDLRARWQVIDPEQLDGLDDDLFDYPSSHYGLAPRQRLTQSYLTESHWGGSDRENNAVPYHLGIRCRAVRQIETALEGGPMPEGDAARHPLSSEVEPGNDRPGVATAKGDAQPEVPHETVALRLKARTWLAAHVADGKHRDRDSTLAGMRAAHPGLGMRGSKAVWSEFAKTNPQLQLSRRGAKLKRNANN